MRLFLFAVIYSILPSGWSQSFNYHTYTVEDGLLSSQTFDLLEDKDKFVWIASEKGVSRFDGYTFTNFGTAEGLPHAPVYKLYEDPFRRIWFLSVIGELSYFEYGKIVPFKYNKSLQELSNHTYDIISGFGVMADSTLIIGTVYSGAFRVYNNGRIEKIGRNDIHESECAVLQLDNRTVMSYAFHNMTRETFKPGPIRKKLSIYEGNELKYSVFSYNPNTKKLLCLQRKNGHIVYASHGFIIDYYKGKAIVQDNWFNEVISLFEDRDSCLWIGYYEGGVRKFPANKSFTGSEGKLYFPKKQISRVMEDYEHGFWFTTLHDGLLYAPTVKIENLFPGDPLNDEGKAVALETDQHSLVYLGTNKSTVLVYSGGKQKHTITLKGDRGTGIVRTLFFDTLSSDLYISTYRKGYILDKKQRLTPISKPALSLSTNKKGILYAGYYNSIFRNYPHKLSADIFIDRKYVRADVICFDHHDVLWIGNLSGLFYWRNGKVTACEAETKRKVQCLAVVKDVVYAGTAEGDLLEVNTQNKKLIGHHMVDGSVYHFLPLGDSLLGISSSRGALFYHIKRKKIVYRLTRTNGLRSTEVRQMKLLNDTLYVMTYDGVSYLRLADLTANVIPPYTHILGCYVDSINYIGQENPEFGYSRNFITFNFVGLSHRSLGKVQYHYRLKGYSDEWKAINVNSVQFPFLLPGSYVFEVRAMNEDGVESLQPASFSFTILTPFWKTAWFIGLVILLVLAVIVLVFTVRYRRLKERNNMLLQINDLRQKAITLQMNPHFVFNSLNSIQSFVLSEDSYKATKYLSRFAKLIRMGLYHANSSLISLEDEVTLLNLYLELEQMRFKNAFHYSISIETGILPKGILIPPMLVQPLVENCVKHGIDLKSCDNFISVDFFRKNGVLKCRIEDNGRGIRSAVRSKRLQPEVEVHRSMGMSITMQRIQLFCEKEGYPYSFEITDKSEQDKNHMGTIICFTIPYSNHDQSVYYR